MSADAHLAGLPERHDAAGAVDDLTLQVVEDLAARGHAHLRTINDNDNEPDKDRQIDVMVYIVS